MVLPLLWEAEGSQVICKNCADLADDPSVMSHDVGDCDEVGCACQHKSPGSWNATEKTARLPLNSLTPSGTTTMSVSQALRLIRESQPSQCSVCMRRVALTPKSGRIVRHKREMLVEETWLDRKTQKTSLRRSIRRYRCDGSGKAPLQEKDTVPTAASLLELTADD